MQSDFGTLELFGLVMIAVGFACLCADPLLDLLIGR
jgi:hypothetical protein